MTPSCSSLRIRSAPVIANLALPLASASNRFSLTTSARRASFSASSATALRVSGNGRHDQGVVADVVAPGLRELDDEIPGGRLALLVLDGVTNPANVGMIIRTVTGAGLDGVVLPRAGSPDVGPLVVKASAGVAFRARVYRSTTAAAAVDRLRGAGVEVVGLQGGSAESLFDAELPERVAFVLGNETEGVSVAVDRWVSIPMSNGVESLNVAVAAGLVAYEVSRRGR